MSEGWSGDDLPRECGYPHEAPHIGARLTDAEAMDLFSYWARTNDSDHWKGRPSREVLERIRSLAEQAMRGKNRP